MPGRILIEDEARQAAVIENARAAGCVAVDTEFVWTRTYYPILGVVQVGWSKEDAYLLDTTRLSDLSPLGELMADPAVEKILHDAPQDLTILRRSAGANPRNIFDTRLACGFCDWSAAWGLGRLLEESLGIELDKSETRTDWVRRPLTDKQVEYALDDIKFLPAAREILIERVAAAGNLAWMEEEMAKYDDPSLYTEKDPYEQYTRVKGSGGFNGFQMAALRELVAWREIAAAERDIPKNRVAPDVLLLDVASALPATESALRRIQTKERRGLERNVRELMDVLKACEGQELEIKRNGRMDAMTRKAVDNQVKRLAEELKNLCAGLQLDPIMAATRADLKELVMVSGSKGDVEGTRIMQGWRREAVGDHLSTFLEG